MTKLSRWLLRSATSGEGSKVQKFLQRTSSTSQTRGSLTWKKQESTREWKAEYESVQRGILQRLWKSYVKGSLRNDILRDLCLQCELALERADFDLVTIAWAAVIAHQWILEGPRNVTDGPHFRSFVVTLADAALKRVQNPRGEQYRFETRDGDRRSESRMGRSDSDPTYGKVNDVHEQDFQKMLILYTGLLKDRLSMFNGMNCPFEAQWEWSSAKLMNRSSVDYQSASLDNYLGNEDFLSVIPSISSLCLNVSLLAKQIRDLFTWQNDLYKDETHNYKTLIHYLAAQIFFEGRLLLRTCVSILCWSLLRNWLPLPNESKFSELAEFTPALFSRPDSSHAKRAWAQLRDKAAAVRASVKRSICTIGPNLQPLCMCQYEYCGGEVRLMECATQAITGDFWKFYFCPAESSGKGLERSESRRGDGLPEDRASMLRVHACLPRDTATDRLQILKEPMLELRDCLETLLESNAPDFLLYWPKGGGLAPRKSKGKRNPSLGHTGSSNALSAMDYTATRRASWGEGESATRGREVCGWDVEQPPNQVQLIEIPDCRSLSSLCIFPEFLQRKVQFLNDFVYGLPSGDSGIVTPGIISPGLISTGILSPGMLLDQSNKKGKKAKFRAGEDGSAQRRLRGEDSGLKPKSASTRAASYLMRREGSMEGLQKAHGTHFVLPPYVIPSEKLLTGFFEAFQRFQREVKAVDRDIEEYRARIRDSRHHRTSPSRDFQLRRNQSSARLATAARGRSPSRGPERVSDSITADSMGPSSARYAREKSELRNSRGSSAMHTLRDRSPAHPIRDDSTRFPSKDSSSWANLGDKSSSLARSSKESLALQESTPTVRATMPARDLSPHKLPQSALGRSQRPYIELPSLISNSRVQSPKLAKFADPYAADGEAGTQMRRRAGRVNRREPAPLTDRTVQSLHRVPTAEASLVKPLSASNDNLNLGRTISASQEANRRSFQSSKKDDRRENDQLRKEDLGTRARDVYRGNNVSPNDRYEEPARLEIRKPRPIHFGGESFTKVGEGSDKGSGTQERRTDLTGSRASIQPSTVESTPRSLNSQATRSLTPSPLHLYSQRTGGVAVVSSGWVTDRGISNEGPPKVRAPPGVARPPESASEAHRKKGGSQSLSEAGRTESGSTATHTPLDVRESMRGKLPGSSRVRQPSPLGGVHIIAASEVKLDKSRRIGEGATSSVYRGWWKGTEVAVKVFKEKAMNEVLSNEELSIVLKIRHPNLVLVMGIVESQAVMNSQSTMDSIVRLPAAMVSEYCSGGTLFDLVHRGPLRPLPPTWIVKIALDISKGCCYLHSFEPPIIHRDLKSLNILLSFPVDPLNHPEMLPFAKISDFGLSRSVTAEGGFLINDDEHSSSSRPAVGTFHWMAPEAFRGLPQNSLVDVYSFGICLYELLSGQIPFAEHKKLPPREIGRMASMMGCRPDLSSIRPGLLPRLVELMQMCWAQNPQERPPFEHITKILQQEARNLKVA